MQSQAASDQPPNRSTFAPPPKESGYIPAPPPPPPPASPAAAAAATPSGYQQNAYAGLPRHGVENFISRPLANYPQPAVSHYPSLPVMELMETRHQPTAYRPPTEASTAARYNSMFFRNGTGERYSRFQSPLAIQTAGGAMFEDDLMSGRRAFPLSHGLVPTPQFSFGFPMHSPHDPMSLAAVGQSQQFGSYPHLPAPDPKRMLGGVGMGVGMATSPDAADKNIKITLENRDLWSRFHALGTEMIITKTGR
ncbi:optomotor-blind protein-like [Pomacea canaliculata]|nr:optomotor-blind protein-like [Pomacea canaliculata]